jgi:iron(III) transport system permease protein
VLLAQVFSFTPIAFLVLIGVVEGISPTMEEASQTLRASHMRTFSSVTLPLMLPGLANAWLVAFVESLADFGNPIVLGGSFGVLSTEIFFAVVGAQQDFGRAAVLAAVMLCVALLAFIGQRLVVGTRSYVSMTGKGDVGLPQPLPAPREGGGLRGRHPLGGADHRGLHHGAGRGLRARLGARLDADVEPFPARLRTGMGAERRLIFSGGAWHSLFTTIQLAAIAAPITAGVGLLAAWVLTRQRFAGRTALEFALMLTFAVPGTVIGVAYILTYNLPPLEITGTASILVICFVSATCRSACGRVSRP